ncbi:MAG: caspase family protein [Candidatus Cloacimonetes bacterium]|nr:caspase family protein [Candidatus Cloacimonadota bacterium]
MKNSKTKLSRLIGIPIIGIVIFAFSISYADVSKEQARDLVLNQIIGEKNIKNVNVYQETDIIFDSLYVIDICNSIDVPYTNCWLFFVDDIPTAGWEHNCRYVFVNSVDGSYQIINETVPPLNFNTELEEVSINVFIEPYNNPSGPPATLEPPEPDPTKYAVLFTGYASSQIRFWNDMSAMYTTLKQQYGFMDDNIFVLFDNGPQGDPDYDDLDKDENWPDIDGECTYNDINDAFVWMADNLGLTDMLFVFVCTHGGQGEEEGDSYLKLDEGEHLDDWQLASMVEPINCSQMIFFLEACHVGGFVGDLEGPKRTIHTSTDWENSSWSMMSGPTAGFNEFAYFWTSAVRGYYPYDRLEPWLPGEEVGSHTIFSFDYDPDLNLDGEISMEEAFQFANDMDQYSEYGYVSYETIHREYPQFSTNLDCSGYILTLRGLVEDITDYQTISGVYYIQGGDLIVGQGVDLTIEENSCIYFLDRSKIVVESGGSINFGDNCFIVGEFSTIYEDPPFVPETIPGNKVEIYGDFSFGENVIFRATDEDKYWDGLFIYSPHTVLLNDIYFENCSLFNENGSIEISNCDFYRSGITSKNSTMIRIGNCNLDECNSIRYFDCIFAGLRNSNITNTYDIGVVIHNCDGFDISENWIGNCNDTGINIFESGNFQSVIYNNTISHNGYGDGIRLYSSVADIVSNVIQYNFCGIISFHNSTVIIEKKEDTGPWEYNSLILNNLIEEILFTHDSEPEMDWKMNKIVDNNFELGTRDQYLICCADHPVGGSHHVMRYNYWGTNCGSERFFPPDVYWLEPMWDPPNPEELESTLAQELYHNATENAKDENYEEAEIIFKDIISQYPETKYSKWSMKNLLTLEKSSDKHFSSLQTYYINNPNKDFDNEMSKLSDYLINSCYIEMRQYETAIAHFEDKILNSTTSDIDSIFAVIDAGYTYLLMESSGSRYVGRLSYLKPKTYPEFKKKTDELLSMIINRELENEDVLMPEFRLSQNFPNPFSPTDVNPETAINFLIPSTIKVYLSIYNIKGQKVCTLVNNKLEKGIHSVIWDGKDENGNLVSSGIYLYKLKTGNKTAVKKMILLR